ncbi:unnamed protein product [Onchocerca ochengi]|uniref:SKIP_SNW domain-containing protein n=1 Tax=Onchocerca ochengi TaxID=42157 RepID=A0A182E9Y7_ONCOC|nr:unnamed protein product [Onchocerca ochengi]
MSIKLADILPPPSTTSDGWFSIRDPWFQKRDVLKCDNARAAKKPPPYGERNCWIPREEEDFGDGGAFPEILVAQFPLGMGLDLYKKSRSDKTIALQCDAEGKLRHDAIARIGHSKDKIIYTRLVDMKPKVLDEEDESFQKPNEETIIQQTEATRLALEKITSMKVASALPVRHAQKQDPVQYIRYTPSQQGDGYNSGAKQRIIRMVEVQQDPMEPPKFKINRKIPRAPPSPPPPVMHSPPRKTTVELQVDWKIPPCISNWKNPKGFTIALDKRLVVDGRGLQQVHINENFAKLAESLYFAEHIAREAVKTRAQMERHVAQYKKAKQEEKMKDMAAKARQQLAVLKEIHEDNSVSQKARERDQIRRDRLDEYRRKRNIARNNPDKLDGFKKDRERDISEKIVLGLPDARTRHHETQFDQRLFDQSNGLDSGGINDETYSAYDKPWRAQDNISQHIYRPSKNLDKDLYDDDLGRIISTYRFVPDKGFSDTEPGVTRNVGPIEFEKEEEDIFGIGQLLQSAKESKRLRKRTTDGDNEGSSSSKKRR